MSQEIETAATGAIGGFWRFRRRKDHAAHTGLCANCGTTLLGAWCHQCGQLAEDFHRSSLKLIGEMFEGLLHFDGRLWTTLPDLFFRPAQLTRRYLEGHRAPQIPPLRLFLVVLLLVFFAGSLGSRPLIVNTVRKDDHGKIIATDTGASATMTPQDRAEAEAALSQAKQQIATVRTMPFETWIEARARSAFADPEKFKLVLEQWSERFAFLMLPIAAALLSLLFIAQRQFYLFDHTIFSLHSLSATGLILALSEILSKVSGGAAQILVLAAPVHLFFHMRGVYRTSVPGVLVRMAFLFVGSTIGAGLLILGLLWIGLNGMGG